MLRKFNILSRENSTPKFIIPKKYGIRAERSTFFSHKLHVYIISIWDEEKYVFQCAYISKYKDCENC